MRICVISTTIFKLPVTGYAGLEHLAWQQAKGLAAKGHEVTLIAPDGSECLGTTILPIGPERSADEHRAYDKYWPKLLDFDCIIDHTWNKWAYILKQEGRLKAPVLGICHAPVNTMMAALPQVDKTCFVCISKDQAAHFEALYGRPARVAYNGVDLDFYKPMGVPRSGRFLFLARFSTIKGPDLALEACRKAGVGLDLVGDTTITGEPELLEKCKRLADGKQIKTIGGVPRGETVWWYSQAHCLIHPNQRFREPFGLAPVEAMACGCPVIAWDYGAMRETVKHGETGWLVKDMDGLVNAVTYATQDTGIGPAFRSRSGCREWASQFSEQRMIDRYDELIHEAVDGGGW